MSTEGDWAVVDLPSGRKGIARRGPSLWALEYPTAGDEAYIAANPRPEGAWAAPTIPSPQRLITLGQGLNTVAVSGGTQSYTIRVVNESSDTWDQVAIEYLSAGDADILALWVGVQSVADTGADYEPDGGVGNFQRALFGGSGTKTVTGGTLESPEVIWTDVLNLATTCPPGGALVLRWIFGGGSVSFVRNGGAMGWPSGLVRDEAFASGDMGSTAGDLDNGLGWSPGYAAPLHAVWVGFSGGDPEVQVLMFGDSVVEQERPAADPGGNNPREGLIFLSDAELERMHAASAGNGGFTLDQAVDRIDAQIASLVGKVDIIGFQTPSHNQKPANVASIGSFMTRVAAVKATVEAAGMGFFVFTLTGPTDDYTADEIAGWNALRAELASTYPGNYVDSAPAVMTGSVNNNTYLTDKVHIASTGAAVAEASFWPQLVDVATAMGYGSVL